MNRTRILLAALAAFIAASCDAASLNLYQKNGAYLLFLNAGAQNGSFDSIDVSISTLGSSSFINNDVGFNGFVPRSPGEPYTFINQWLGLNQALGGYGFSILGATNTPKTVAFGGGPLGQKISTPAGPGLLLANLYRKPDFSANVALISGGNIIDTLFTVVPLEPLPILPEPRCLALAGGIASLAFFASQRRHQVTPVRLVSCGRGFG